MPTAKRQIEAWLPSIVPDEPMYLIVSAGGGGGWAVNAYRPKEAGVISLNPQVPFVWTRLATTGSHLCPKRVEGVSWFAPRTKRLDRGAIHDYRKTQDAPPGELAASGRFDQTAGCPSVHNPAQNPENLNEVCHV